MWIEGRWKKSLPYLITRIREMKKAEALGEPELKQLQERRFKGLLRCVLRSSPFYRQYYSDHGIDIENVDGIELQDLPTIDKQLMMEHYDRLVCDSRLRREELEQFVSDRSAVQRRYAGDYEVVHTSGSSGKIGLFVYGQEEWAVLKAMVFTRVSRNRINPRSKERYAFLGAVDGRYAGISLAQASPSWLLDFLPLDINEPLQDIVSKLNDFQPELLSGYSSGIYFLALEQLQGNLAIQPGRVLCSADPLTEMMRQSIRRAFSVEPKDYYAASEALCMASQCEQRGPMHLFNDWHMFEVLKPDGSYAKPGEEGRLILTNLYNKTQPLIRYEMQDTVVVAENDCSCSWPFPVIQSVAGRNEEFIYFQKQNGELDYIHPIVFSEFIVPGLDKLQVIETGQNQLRLDVVIRGDTDTAVEAVRQRMDEILRTKGLADTVRFSVNVVADIKNDPVTGKYQLIVPREGD